MNFLSIPLYVHDRILKEKTAALQRERDDAKHRLDLALTANKRLQKDVARYKRSAGFYDLIEASIHDDPMLQDAWGGFIATLALRLDEPVPGLTCAEKQ